MNHAFGTTLRILAWALASMLVALPVIAVVNGWIGAERWPLRVLRINDGLQQVDVARVRAAVLTHAQSGFFAVDLAAIQQDLAALPWVAGAEVRKQWPDVLEVHVSEHVPFARWGDQQLLSTRGRLFAADGVDVPADMPRFEGPEARIDDIVALYNESSELFRQAGVRVERVALDARGSWQLTLSGGTEVVVGSQEAGIRLARFARMLPVLTNGRADVLARADLRYTNGFALVWAEPGAGVAVSSPDSRISNHGLS